MKSCHFYRIAQCSSKNSMTLSSFSMTFPWLSSPGKWSSLIPWLSMTRRHPVILCWINVSDWRYYTREYNTNTFFMCICWSHFPSVLCHCWLGDRKGIWPVKSWVLVCRWWQFDWSFARLVAPLVVTTTSIILSCYTIQNGDILVPANPGLWKNGR